MKTIIPMAGKGLRFKKAGYDIPKWCIKIFDKYLIEWALMSVEDITDNFVFIINKEDMDTKKAKEILKNIVKKPFEVVSTYLTRGQAETVLKADPCMSDGDRVIILNCDNIVKVNILPEIKQRYNGIIPIFSVAGKSEDYKKSKSYVLLNDKGLVEKTSEKEVLSDYATAGMYYFRYWKQYKKICKYMINNNQLVKNEFYVVPMYNYIDNVKTVVVDHFFDIGTPQCLNQFMSGEWAKFVKDNPTDSMGIDYTQA